MLWVHARTAASHRATVVLLTKKSSRRAFEKFTAGSDVNQDHTWPECGTKKVLQILRASLSMFTYFGRDLHICNHFFPLRRGSGVSSQFLNGPSFL